MSAVGVSTTFSDLFEFNVLCAQALFNSTNLTEKTFTQTLESVRPRQGFISKTFSGVYYTDIENGWLDGMLHTMRSMPKAQKHVFFYTLVQACLKKRPYNLFHRANLYMRLAKVSRGFGNNYSWEKTFNDHMLTAFKELKQFQSFNGQKVKVVSSRDIFEHEDKYGMVYLDPPYIKQTASVETYLLRYHFLEGLARESDWPDIVDLKTKTKRINDFRYSSEWSSSDGVLAGLERTMTHFQKAKVALSYVDESRPTIQQICAVFRNHGRRVAVYKANYKTALSANRREELLFIAS